MAAMLAWSIHGARLLRAGRRRGAVRRRVPDPELVVGKSLGQPLPGVVGGPIVWLMVDALALVQRRRPTSAPTALILGGWPGSQEQALRSLFRQPYAVAAAGTPTWSALSALEWQTRVSVAAHSGRRRQRGWCSTAAHAGHVKIRDEGRASHLGTVGADCGEGRLTDLVRRLSLPRAATAPYGN